MHPRLRPWFDLCGVLVDIAEAGGGSLARAIRRPSRDGRNRVRRPGEATPLWNACAELLQAELRTKNAKVLLARHLGIPKQRFTDFVVTRTRLPDAELTLQLLTWVAEKRAGRDPIQQTGTVNSRGSRSKPRRGRR
jgi:hypothetical protein